MRLVTQALGLIALTLAVLARPHAATAGESDEPISGAAYLGGYYGFGAGDTVDFDSGQYPTFGALFDSKYVRFSGETPFPFLLFDLGASLILFAAGEDEGLPIFDSLNGDLEPGRVGTARMGLG
jgi:hypothetical protein